MHGTTEPNERDILSDKERNFMFEKIETMEEWALKNQNTIFRFWNKDNEDKECEYIFIEELIVAPNGKILMGYSTYDYSKPNERYDYLDYCFLDEVTLNINPREREEA